MICIGNIACLLMATIGTVTNYPMIPMVRTTCHAPAGVWRFGGGRFGEFAFGERITSFSEYEKLSCVQADGATRVVVKVRKPYFGFKEAKLHFGKTNRLFKVEMQNLIPPDEMASQTALKMSKIMEDLSRFYKTQFKKKEGVQEPHVINQYLSKDSDFIISILLSRSDEGKMLTLCVENVKIRKQKIQGSDAKPVEVDVEIES